MSKSFVFRETCYYDLALGYVTRGVSERAGLVFQMSMVYAEPLGCQTLLEVHYQNPLLSMTAMYYTMSGNGKQKIPTAKIQRLLFTVYSSSHVYEQDEQLSWNYMDSDHSGSVVVQVTPDKLTYETVWDYARKRHPEIVTYDEHGHVVQTPLFLSNDTYNVVRKPDRLFFSSEDLFLDVHWANLFGKNGSVNKNTCHQLQFGPRKARSALWKIWFSTHQIDGVWARLIDECLLRKEPLLRDYWRMRKNTLIDMILDFCINNKVIFLTFEIKDNIWNLMKK